MSQQYDLNITNDDLGQSSDENVAETLAICQLQAENSKLYMRNLIDKVKMTEEYRAYEGMLNWATERYAVAKEVITERAVENWRKTGEKTFIASKVREKTIERFDYSIEDAFAHCVAHAPHIIELNVGKFEKYAVSQIKLGGAKALSFLTYTSKKEPEGYIPSDLSQYLPKDSLTGFVTEDVDGDDNEIPF